MTQQDIDILHEIDLCLMELKRIEQTANRVHMQTLADTKIIRLKIKEIQIKMQAARET